MRQPQSLQAYFRASPSAAPRKFDGCHFLRHPTEQLQNKVKAPPKGQQLLYCSFYTPIWKRRTREHRSAYRFPNPRELPMQEIGWLRTASAEFRRRLSPKQDRTAMSREAGSRRQSVEEIHRSQMRCDRRRTGGTRPGKREFNSSGAVIPSARCEVTRSCLGLTGPQG